MGKLKKTTKKFISKKLEDEIKRRRKVQKIKRQRAKKEQEEEEEEEDEQVDLQETNEETEEQEEDAEEMQDDDEVDEVALHREELEYLKEHDPEFIEFLKESDKDLLEFGEKEEDQEEAEEDEKRKGKPLLTTELFKAWEKDALKGSLNALKRVLVAFRAACHYNDEDQKQANAFAYKIISPTVCDHIFTFCTNNMKEILDSHLNPPTDKKSKKKEKKSEEGEEEEEGESKDKQEKLPHQQPNWKKIESAAKSYLGNLVHYINQVTEESMQTFLLKHSEKLVPYMASFPKIAKRFLKILFHIWSTAEDTSRVVAFLNIRHMAIKMPYPFIDLCLKGIYLCFVRNAKFITPKSLPTINLMANCVIELYGLDFISSYQHAFVYIRQLAIHLRNSIQLKTKNAYQNVYNWQFINSLKIWSLLLCAYPDQPDLKHLIYPVIQITIGVIRLIPTSRYFPLRFTCIKMLNDIAAATKVFVNSAPYAIEALECAELKKKTKHTTTKPLDFIHSIKVSKTNLRSKAFQDAVISKVCGSLLEYYSIYSRSIGFPELILPTKLILKKFMKHTPVPTFNKKISQLLDHLEKNAQLISRERDSAGFNPKDEGLAKNFLANFKGSTPLELYYSQYKEEEAKLLKLQQEQYNPDDHEPEWDSELEDDSENEQAEGEEGEDDDDMDDEDEEEETEFGEDGEVEKKSVKKDFDQKKGKKDKGQSPKKQNKDKSPKKQNNEKSPKKQHNEKSPKKQNNEKSPKQSNNKQLNGNNDGNSKKRKRSFKKNKQEGNNTKSKQPPSKKPKKDSKKK